MTSQSWLSDYGTDSEPALDRLTDSQRKAYVAVELNDVSLFEHAEQTGRDTDDVRLDLKIANLRLAEGSR